MKSDSEKNSNFYENKAEYTVSQIAKHKKTAV